MSYTFRIRFVRSPRDTINVQSPMLELSLGQNGKRAVLRARDKTVNIQDSTQLVLSSPGWDSEAEAAAAGESARDALVVTLTHLRVGADFGARAPKSAFTAEGLKWLEGSIGQRALNDVHGLMVFTSEPAPRFVATSADAVRGVPKERFEEAFRRAASAKPFITGTERVAFELFHASMFQQHADARLLLLVMAIEALLNPQPRSASARAHVESIISMTSASSTLSHEEKQSLCGSLRWLLNESINQAGRRLAAERLGSRLYLDRPAPQFFSYCYSVRSRLTHGALPFPTRDEVDHVAATLEVFVSDLLSGYLTDVTV